MLASKGECLYCNKMVARGQIKRHLNTHLKQMETTQASNKKSIFLRATANEMFVYLLLDQHETLNVLDRYLRMIWLECCGHMSSFQEKGVRYDNDWMDMDRDVGEDKSQSVGEVFVPGRKFDYEYDFGSTTHLDIEALGTYNINTPTGFLLLTRNEPLKIMCQICEKKSAELLCGVCWDQPNMFCESCAKKHRKECSDFDEYAEMPIVNSPRMGVCAYMGGSTDRKRDGIWAG